MTMSPLMNCVAVIGLALTRVPLVSVSWRALPTTNANVEIERQETAK